MMPLNSCAVPGRKPGTSTKVTIGILKQSQNRTKRAALMEEAMSRQPASTIGWLATKPTVWPSRRSEEHTSELQSLMRISYAVFCLTNKKKTTNNIRKKNHHI